MPSIDYMEWSLDRVPYIGWERLSVGSPYIYSVRNNNHILVSNIHYLLSGNKPATKVYQSMYMSMYRGVSHRYIRPPITICRVMMGEENGKPLINQFHFGEADNFSSLLGRRCRLLLLSNLRLSSIISHCRLYIHPPTTHHPAIDQHHRHHPILNLWQSHAHARMYAILCPFIN